MISFIYPVQNKALVDELAKKHATVFAMGKFRIFVVCFCLSTKKF